MISIYLDLAMQIIEGLPRIDNSPLVFTLNGRNAFTNFHRLKDRVHHLMGAETPYWQIRDLRRTATTLMASIGVPHHIADKVLNHASGEISGVKAVYNRFEYLPERQYALEALSRKIGQLIGRDIGNCGADDAGVGFFKEGNLNSNCAWRHKTVALPAGARSSGSILARLR